MEVSRKDIDALNAEITVKISPEDYQEKVNQSLKNYRKQAKMPGFRPGMVPMGMIKKMVGTNILVEEVNKVLSNAIYTYVMENKIDMLGNPLPKAEDSAINWEKDTEFEFTYELGLAPEVKVAVTEKDKFDKYKIKVDDKMLEEQVNEMAKRFGKMEEVDASEEGDMLYGTFNELEKGEIKEAGIFNKTVLNIDNVDDKKIKKQLVGLKLDDQVNFKPTKAAASNTVAAWLGVDQEALADLKSEFRFTVERINRMQPAELNQELFDKIYGPGQVTSVDGLKERIQEEMEKGFANSSEQLFERDIQESLIKKAKLSLPDEFMKKWLMSANEKPLTAEQVEEEYDQYAKGLKWQLIENKLLKDHNISVTDEEILEHTKGLLRQQLASMGQNFMGDDEIEETAQRVLKNEDESRRLYDQLYQVKLRDLYNSTVKIREKEISYNEFVKLAEKK